MAVGGREILAPERNPGVPIEVATGVAVVPAGRIHQAREGEFGLLLIIRRQGIGFVFDARVLLERLLEGVEGRDQQKAAGEFHVCLPEEYHSRRCTLFSMLKFALALYCWPCFRFWTEQGRSRQGGVDQGRPGRPDRRDEETGAGHGGQRLQFRRARVSGVRDVEVSRRTFSKKKDSRSSAAYAGIPTAWVASWGSGKPVISLGSDIDDIPQASQKPGVGYHDPMIEGAPGHGEGHNSGVPLNIVAAIAVKRIMEREHLKGTIRLWPGVAEEEVGAKAYFVKAGMFKDVDVCLFTHVAANFGVVLGTCGQSERAGVGRVYVQGRERSRGGRAVAREERARRGGTDGRRLEFPPRASAPGDAPA